MNYFLFLILFLSSSMFSQKKEIYFNIDKVEVNKGEFDDFRKSHESVDYFVVKSENDNMITHTMYSTLQMFKFSENDLISFLKYIENLASEKLDSKKNTMIQYIPILDDCILMTKDSRIRKIIKKEKNFNKMVVIIEKNHPKNKSGNYGAEDNDNYIKSFFSADLGCGNHIVVQPDGNCKILLGENDIYKILN